MKKAHGGVVLLLILLACKKPVGTVPPQIIPGMKYFNLAGQETKYNVPQYVDLDGDGKRDFSFVTYLIGDPLYKRDKIQFSATSGVDRMMLIGQDENTPLFKKGDMIGSDGIPGYQWIEVGSIPLMQKIMEIQKPAYWIGNWKNARHKYMAFQVRDSGKLYYGWFELSTDTTLEKIVLHRAAISREAQTNIKAGL